MNPKRIPTMIMVFLLACGPAAWAANLNVKGNVNVQGDGSTASPGNLGLSGSFQAPKYFCTYSKTLTGKKSTETVTMGTWDICYLSNMYLAGMDDGSSDSAQCKVNPATGLQTGRPNWTMTVASGSDKIDKLECTATCFSFSTTATGTTTDATC